MCKLKIMVNNKRKIYFKDIIFLGIYLNTKASRLSSPYLKKEEEKKEKEKKRRKKQGLKKTRETS